ARFADAAELRRALDAISTEARSWAPTALVVRDLEAPARPERVRDIQIAMEPPPPVAVAEAEPVAVSVLAHLETPATQDAPATQDGEATGLRPTEEKRASQPEPRRRSRRWIAFVAAFVLAVAVGAGIELLRNRGGHSQGAPPTRTPSSSVA